MLSCIAPCIMYLGKAESAECTPQTSSLWTTWFKQEVIGHMSNTKLSDSLRTARSKNVLIPSFTRYASILFNG